MDIALVTLLDLLTDDDRMSAVEQVVRGLGVAEPDGQVDLRAITAAAEQPLDAYRLCRARYVALVEGSFDDAAEERRGTRTRIAYVAAALAARAGRLHDARRWLHVGHIEAQADTLGDEEVALFVAAIGLARR